MALPTMTAPAYPVTIPSTGKQVTFRPFLVREEKALLIAQQSEDPNTMIASLKQVIHNCIKDANPEELAIFDYEYLFTQIRAKSVGEIAEVVFLCDTCEDEKARVNVRLDLTKFTVKFPEGVSNKIDLNSDVGVMMKYPNIDTLIKLEKASVGDVDSLFDVVSECIDYIYTKDEVFPIKEQTKEETVKFLEELTQEQFAKIEKFFAQMPKMSQQVTYDCPVCSKHHDKVLEGMESFF